MRATSTARQAIRTAYIGPGNVKGSRISASCDAKRIFVEYDDALNPEENHAAACEALCKKLGWPCDRIGGAMGNVHYWVERG